jgi:hypothetical protein
MPKTANNGKARLWTRLPTLAVVLAALLVFVLQPGAVRRGMFGIYGYDDYLIVFVLVPALMVWGWRGYAKNPKNWSVPSICSLSGLALATFSSLFAIMFLLHAPSMNGGIWIFDRWANFFASGILFNLVAIVFGVFGLLKRNPLRWRALVCAVITFPFWFAVGVGA